MSDADRQWGHRLKQARTSAGLSQKQLGIQAGIDEFVASTRINRYELGVHKPDFQTAQNLARVLNISAAFLYAPEDDIAALLFRYSRATEAQRGSIRQLLGEIADPVTAPEGSAT
ncbi:MAG: XRE family transcriptional regulator [Alcaligenaceae bacterium]|nr:MAG: XRE family transcriptional regulator [Alcaligenaceae bacterium]